MPYTGLKSPLKQACDFSLIYYTVVSDLLYELSL